LEWTYVGIGGTRVPVCVLKLVPLPPPSFVSFLAGKGKRFEKKIEVLSETSHATWIVYQANVVGSEWIEGARGRSKAAS
jgi:hypothetical protein